MSAPDNIIGKVLKVTRKTYDVSLKNRIVSCTVRGKLVAKKSDYTSVKVGDNVEVSLVNEQEGVIERILPRKSQLSRSIESRAYHEHVIATNIDQILVVLSTRKPPFKSGLLDRYLAIANKNRLRAFICINKLDLSSPEEFRTYLDYYPKIGNPLYLTSALTGAGISDLKEILNSSVTALVGQSGVGKSSIINAIDPGLDIKVGTVSERTRKGQHITTVVQLFPLSSGGYVIDTPGIRELGFWGIYKKDLQEYFVEIRARAGDCQFADCTHVHEPACAVKSAVQEKTILPERYSNYIKIYHSLKSAAYE